ncbi:MAG: cytochrome b/b6 domain-containing protein [Chlamydiia bacterium]|nr:cytochrome b/b6 domain-containing protein [Chlamydiia bacterium]
MVLLKNFPKSFSIVHWGIALCVIGSMISSLFVHPKNPVELPIQIHVWIGYGVTLFLLCQWLLLSLKKYHFVRAHVFPYHFEGRQCILADLRMLLRGQLPPTGARKGLSGLVEGMGILLISFMAVTGLIFHFAFVYSMDQIPLMLIIRDIHNFFSYFVWVFVIGHGGMAILHRIMNLSK